MHNVKRFLQESVCVRTTIYSLQAKTHPGRNGTDLSHHRKLARELQPKEIVVQRTSYRSIGNVRKSIRVEKRLRHKCVTLSFTELMLSKNLVMMPGKSCLSASPVHRGAKVFIRQGESGVCDDDGSGVAVQAIQMVGTETAISPWCVRLTWLSRPSTCLRLKYSEGRVRLVDE